MAFEREPVGTVETWTSALQLDPERYSATTPEEIAAIGAGIQRDVIEVATETKTSMVGWYEPTSSPPRLVLARWPAHGEGSVAPTDTECETARDVLAERLGAEKDNEPVIPPGSRIGIMGTFAVYGNVQIATVADRAAALSRYQVDDGYMVYARIANGQVAEDWHEPVGIVWIEPDQPDDLALTEMYELAASDEGQQAHFPLHGEQWTRMYDTPWAHQSD